MGGGFQALLDWLNSNNQALTLLAAAVAAGAAVVSTSIGIPVWLATRRQAILTRQTFEASNTPYVSARVEEPTDTSKEGVLSFNVVFENQSTVLAHIVGWEIHGELTELEPLRQDPLFCAFSTREHTEGALGAGQRTVIQARFLDKRLPHTDRRFYLTVKVAYRGPGLTVYVTDFMAFRGNTNHAWSGHQCHMRRRENGLLAALGA